MSAEHISGSGGRRRLIMHLGVHKTSSTAIQRHLYRNAQTLSDRLIVRTPVPQTPMQALGQAAMRFSLTPSSDTETLLKVALGEVLDSLPDNDLPVLISHENVAGAPPGKGGETRLYPALPRIAALIQKRARDFDLSFVFYSRGMKSWRSSLWAQIVRSEGYDREFSVFARETQDLPGWGDLRKRMASAVGEIMSSGSGWRMKNPLPARARNCCAMPVCPTSRSPPCLSCRGPRMRDSAPQQPNSFGKSMACH